MNFNRLYEIRHMQLKDLEKKVVLFKQKLEEISKDEEKAWISGKMEEVEYYKLAKKEINSSLEEAKKGLFLAYLERKKIEKLKERSYPKTRD